MKDTMTTEEYRARRKPKYGNVRVCKFDSKKERDHHEFLQWREHAGEITELDHHVVFPLVVFGVEIGKYIADHVYRERGELIVEDTKSAATRMLPVYRLKKKLMQALYNLEIHEV